MVSVLFFGNNSKKNIKYTLKNIKYIVDVLLCICVVIVIIILGFLNSLFT
jgi:hypothetical protein